MKRVMQSMITSLCLIVIVLSILGWRITSLQGQVAQLRVQVEQLQVAHSGSGGGSPAQTTAVVKSVPPHLRRRTAASPEAMQAGLAAAIHADVAASVYDPARAENVWVFGDATTIGGVSQTTTGYFPRNELGLQASGSATFTILPGPYGPKDPNGHTWEQVPGQANGNFWPSGILLDGSSIWLLGNAVTGLQTVGDAEVAQFNASTLAFEGVTDLQIGTEVWGISVLAPGGGFYVTGTQNVCGSTDNCKQGDVAWIPSGGEQYPASWVVTGNVFPPSLNTGTIISPVANGTSWLAYTKQGDAYGGTKIEKLTAPSMLGPWSLTSWTYDTSPPPGDFSYDVQIHLGEDEPTGTLLLTYAMNQTNGGQLDYYPRFLTVTP